MTLNPKLQVELQENGNSSNYPAVYKVLKTYRNEKGQPTCERVNIGKFD
ncbi:MAG: hypothetical protein LBE38_04490 [Deltaproteobacteria bacterium]|nr:hypothetical protein [Deltaproteobacteria bacterium]